MGRYVNSTLGSKEIVVYEGQYHWVIFITPFALCTLLIYSLIDWYFTEIVITSQRLIIKTGLINVKTLDLNISQIESLSFEQNIIGRVLGYGTLKICGSGGTHQIFQRIAHPILFRRAYQSVI